MRFEQKQEGVYEDQETGLQWSKTLGLMFWQDAMDFCQNLKLGEHYDWRLPTLQELFFLVDYTEYNPATKLSDTVEDYYWSATSHAVVVNWYWYMGFSLGFVGSLSKINSLYVRAVRGGKGK